MRRPLRPFFSYYGAKWRLAGRYPRPQYEMLHEAFAGSACYSLHWHDRRVVLCDSDEIIAGVWRYLITVKESEILSIPESVDSVDELSAWPQEARWLVGFWLTRAGLLPNKSASLWRRRHRGERHYALSFWGREIRERIASQLAAIRHWRIVEGSYEQLPDDSATWFLDPPYQGRPGSHYRHGSQRLDYAALGAWCQSRQGQVIVCEAQGATWLPFEPFAVTSAYRHRRSAEAIWTNYTRPGQLQLRGAA